MTVEWTKDAVEAALDVQDSNWRCAFEEDSEHARCDMRAALDAAVKAQEWGGRQPSKEWLEALMKSVGETIVIQREIARAEALEKAANVARDCAIYDANDRLLNSDIRATCAAAIRALKDKPANQTDGGE